MVTAASQPGPLRVLQVTEASGGGVRRHLHRVIPELRRLGLAVDVLMGTGRAEPDLEGDLAVYRDLGCGVAVFGGTGTLPVLAAGVPVLRRALRVWQPAVVHLHATRAGLMGRLALGGVDPAAAVYSPHAFVFQSPVPGLTRWCGRWLERRLARRTAAFVCVSAAEREVALATLPVPAERVHLIENGLDPGFAEGLLPRAAVRAEWGIPADAVLVGFCGRLVPQKDPGTLLDGLAAWRDRPAALRLVVCGAGPLEETLRHRARSLGLAETVSWRGYVPDLPRRLAGLDLLALPSRYEGLSYTLLEALGAGVPVLAADIPANRVRERLLRAMVLAPPGDSSAWAQALMSCWGKLPALQAQAVALAPWVLREFSARRQAEALAALYSRVAVPPGSPASG
jgi:glycosyltransferase involved in cell wall biosynthesis